MAIATMMLILQLSLVSFILLIKSQQVSSSNLIEARDFLRAGDDRLFRRSPHENTIAHQNSKACEDGLLEAFSAVTQPGVLLGQKSIAANIIALCTGNNPRNKAKMWEYGEKLHEALISMILSVQPNDGETLFAASASLEAIWSSTINSPENHALFMKYDIFRAVSNIILMPCTGINPCHFAQMWAAEVVEVLTASHCFTETGECVWEFDDDRRQVTLGTNMGIKLDTEPIRQSILLNRELMTRIIEMACSGPVREIHDEEDYPWPKRAKIGEGSENVRTIKPWAAAGALRNLLISPNAHSIVVPAFKCLCDLQRSPDELEEEKGEDAVYRLGFTEQECPQLYADNCGDLNGWKDTEGYGCPQYERNRWCIEFGDLADANGVTAEFACCVCGGGSTGPGAQMQNF